MLRALRSLCPAPNLEYRTLYKGSGPRASNCREQNRDFVTLPVSVLTKAGNRHFG